MYHRYNISWIGKKWRILEIWFEEIKMMAMDINIEKSKVMIINKETEMRAINKLLSNCKEIEEVSSQMYEYLGVLISIGGTNDMVVAEYKKLIYCALNKKILRKK